MNHFIILKKCQTKYLINIFSLSFGLSVLSLLQLFFAVYRYPLFGSDGIAFLPAAINFANHKGLINEVYHITRLLNGTGIPIYINYPPIFPIFFGWLFRITANIHVNYALVHIASMLLFVFLSNRLFDVFYSRKKSIILFLFLISWNTQLNPGIGRPESLAELFLLLLVISSVLYKNFISYLFSGILIVCIGFTHPVLGVYSCFLLLIYFALFGVRLRSLFLVIFGGLIGLFLVTLVYPYNFINLLDGILRHGKIVAGRSEFDLIKFIHYHFTNPELTFYFVVFLLSIFSYLSFLKTFNLSKSKKVYILSLHILFLSVLFYFTFQTIETSYNLYVLFPLFGFLILSNPLLSVSTYKFCFILVVLSFSSLGFVRRLILFPIHLSQGYSYVKACDELSTLGKSNKKVFIPTSLFNLFNNMENLTDDINDPDVKYVIQQQNYSSSNRPPQISGFSFVNSNYVDSEVNIFGFKLASSPPGYQYALYKKNDRK
jgi:hypothetical protein